MSDAEAAAWQTTLESRLSYEFSDQQLLTQALTHRSFSAAHNERLEFLGDSILSLIITDALYRRFPSANEGEMSRLRAKLVQGLTLTEVANELELGDCLRLGAGEAKSGGRRRASILADAVEAIIGAVYLDSSMQHASDVVHRLYSQRLLNVNPDTVNKDPKTRLQELLQSHKKSLPQYSLLRSSGKAHEKHFVVQCSVTGLESPTEGEGSSRREAEQMAAQLALESFNE